MTRAVVVALLLMVSPFVVFFYSIMGVVYIPLLLWLGAWIWFVSSKEDAFTRGILFVGISVFLAVTSRFVLKEVEPEMVLEMASQMMLIVGGGVGGNFMAHALLTRKPKLSSNKPK